MFEPQAIPIVTESATPTPLDRNPVTVFEKLFWIEGRIARMSYIMLTLLQIVISLAGLAAAVLIKEASEPLAIALMIGLGIAVFWSVLVVTAKRYHDLDASGWWQLLGVIPILAWIIPIYLSLKPGTEGANRFGEQP
jgi:uncharacterized membrane protein YhaH (DUF805 family)